MAPLPIVRVLLLMVIIAFVVSAAFYLVTISEHPRQPSYNREGTIQRGER